MKGVSSQLSTLNRAMSKAEEIDGAGYGKESELWNAILVVEDCHLHVNKEVLMLSSPVFYQMFTAPFKEAQSDPCTVQLPDKTIKSVILMLNYLYPDRATPLTDEMAATLLPLAEEYQLKNLKSKCASELSKLQKPRLELVTLAEKYDVPKLLDKAINSCATNLTPDEISLQQQKPENADISDGALLRIFRAKMSKTKDTLQKLYDKTVSMKNTISPGCKSASCQVSKSLNEIKADASDLQKIITDGSKTYGAINSQNWGWGGYSSFTYR